MAALYEREKCKPESERNFSLDEIMEVHKIAFDQWREAHDARDWDYYDDPTVQDAGGP